MQVWVLHVEPLLHGIQVWVQGKLVQIHGKLLLVLLHKEECRLVEIQDDEWKMSIKAYF